MTGYNQTPLYESPLWQDFNDGLRRPGGLELTDYAAELSGLSAGSKVLDIGCGGGITVEYLFSCFGLEAYGLDRSEKMIKEAQNRFPGRMFIEADSAVIPFVADTFDGVISECSLSIGDDLSPVLDEVRRVLVPGGVLIISDMYNRQDSVISSDDISGSCLQKLKPECDWRKALVLSGYEIYHWEDRSFELSALTARIIFEFGSLDNFYSEWRGSSFSDCSCGSRVGTASKPGYFLCLAGKKKE